MTGLRIATLFFLMLAVHTARAQDYIVLTSGDSIMAKVEEVGVTEIKYKRFNSPDGPVYIIPKANVSYIRYADGSRDIFHDESAPALFNASAKKTDKKKSRSIWTLFAGMSVPVDDYKDPNIGAADNGFLFGVEGLTMFPNSTAYFNYQFCFTDNPYRYDSYLTGLPFTAKGSYSVMHFLIGLGYRTNPSKGVFYLEALAGLNYTTLSGTLSQFGYDDAATGAVCVSTGVVLDRHLNLGLAVYYANTTFENRFSRDFDADQKISFLKLSIGYDF